MPAFESRVLFINRMTEIQLKLPLAARRVSASWYKILTKLKTQKPGHLQRKDSCGASNCEVAITGLENSELR